MLLDFQYFIIYVRHLAPYEPNHNQYIFGKLSRDLKNISPDNPIEDLKACFKKYDYKLLYAVITMIDTMEKEVAKYEAEKESNIFSKNKKYITTLINKHNDLIELYKSVGDKSRAAHLIMYRDTFKALLNEPAEVIHDLQVYKFLSFNPDILNYGHKVHNSKYLISDGPEDSLAFAKLYDKLCVLNTSTNKIIKSVLINIYLLYKYHGNKKIPVSTLEDIKNALDFNVKMSFNKIDDYYIEGFYHNFPLFDYGNKQTLVFEKFKDAAKLMINEDYQDHKKRGVRFDKIKAQKQIDKNLQQMQKNYLLFSSLI